LRGVSTSSVFNYLNLDNAPKNPEAFLENSNMALLRRDRKLTMLASFGDRKLCF
jgi:hypothetical protein